MWFYLHRKFIFLKLLDQKGNDKIKHNFIRIPFNWKSVLFLYCCYYREDPQRWLHKEISWTIDRLRRFSPIPFKQGVLIELEQPNKTNDELNSTITFLCVLQDLQRTLNFLLYVTGKE